MSRHDEEGVAAAKATVVTEPGSLSSETLGAEAEIEARKRELQGSNGVGEQGVGDSHGDEDGDMADERTILSSSLLPSFSDMSPSFRMQHRCRARVRAAGMW